jgi:hypothetical protein
MKSFSSRTSSNEAGRRTALRRFGYEEVQAGDATEELAREWALLAPGIGSWLATIPLSELSSAQRELAIDRVRKRRELDELMRACDHAHSQIAACGARPDLVENYASVRDRFEEAVEAFTTAAEMLAVRFRDSA